MRCAPAPARPSPTRGDAEGYGGQGFGETEFAEAHGHGDTERAREIDSRFTVLQPDDVARSVVHILEAPAHVQIHDLLMRSTPQPG